MSINVAIDGPAGAGKSTISRRAAQALGFIYVDTGALYRTVGLNALRRGVDLENPEAIAESVKGISVELKYENGEQAVFLNGENVSAFIRTPEASMAASKVSAVPAVREFLFGLQQDSAAKNDCVLDGRDIGTVVLPRAQVKIFLTASAEEREIGGLGIFMVRNMMDSMDYRYKDGYNVLTLTLTLAKEETKP